ncbi:MAG: M23 family metallopeptidase [Pseudomonadota bacterium]
MFRALRRNSTAIQTIAVVGICAAVLASAVFSKPRAGHWCPCGVGAAFVAATGSSITAFTLAQITEVYLVLWQGFAAIHTQINGTTNSNQETYSYQTQAYAHVQRQTVMYEQMMDTNRPATIGFQSSATSGASGAELNTNLVRDAIHEENYEWRANLDESTAGTNTGNAAYAINARLEKYCNVRDQALGLCELPDDPRHQDADKNAATLFSQETLDEAMVQPAVDRCRLLAGQPVQAPRPNDYISAGGPERALYRDVNNARAMLSFAMCDYLVASRTELPEESLREWAEEVVKRITGGVGLPPPPSACRPTGGIGGYGGPGSIRIDASCTPFPQGYRYGGSTLSASQVDTLNYVYSLARSAPANFSHNAALALALTVQHETSGGRSLIEGRRMSNGQMCYTNLSDTEGPNCVVPRRSGERCSNVGGQTGYAPTGVGWIQWSGWPNDTDCNGNSGYGRGNVIGNLGFRKCHLVYVENPPYPDCAASPEEAFNNNASAVITDVLNLGSSLVGELRDNNSSGARAAAILTNRWIVPASRQPRIDSMAAAIDGSAGPPDGTCTGAPPPVAGGPPSGGATPVSTGGGVNPSPISRPANNGIAGMPGPSITVPMRSPMGGSGLTQNDCFGNRSNYGTRFHPGVDLVSDSGFIMAAAAGEVINVTDSCRQSSSGGRNTSDLDCGGGLGNTISILHADNSITTYSHNFPGSAAEFGIRRGMQVSMGQTIARMGNTGRSVGTHLDFRVQAPPSSGRRGERGYFVNPHVNNTVAQLPTNNCGSTMGTLEYTACTATSSSACRNRNNWFGPLHNGNGAQSGGGPLADAGGGPGGGGGPAPGFGGPGASCNFETADLGLNLDAEHISHLELMKLVAEYRFQDPGWYEFVMTSANRAQLIRELNAIKATRLYMDWQSYESQVNMAGVVASWAATEAQRSYDIAQ